MGSTFLERIKAGDMLVSDGATGTNLQMRGLLAGKSGEYWVLENPDEIVRLVSDFVAAGSDIVLTCTFGASRVHLAHMELADKTEEINRGAVALARRAVEGSQAWVAGSIGPTGEMLQPFGTLTVEDAEATYREQAHLLAEAGVDLIVVETMFDTGEAQAAVKAVRAVCDLPLVCSFSYDRGTKTMMGVGPTKAAKALEGSGVDLIGINCGRSLDDNMAALKELRSVTSLPIWFKPNAGLPATDALGDLVYDLSPEGMAAPVSEWIAAGAQVIGGCCGTSPEHLKAIARMVKSQG
jgi:5-methyltetrahydrofolate--homocysteine methyltransferase